GPYHRDGVGFLMVGESLGDGLARLLPLRTQRAGGTDGECEELRRIARTGRNVEHLHARLHLREWKELGGMTGRVHAPVLVSADRAIDDGLVAQGGDTRVFGRCRGAATEREHEADDEEDRTSSNRK